MVLDILKFVTGDGSKISLSSNTNAAANNLNMVLILLYMFGKLINDIANN